MEWVSELEDWSTKLANLNNREKGDWKKKWTELGNFGIIPKRLTFVPLEYQREMRKCVHRKNICFCIARETVKWKATYWIGENICKPHLSDKGLYKYIEELLQLNSTPLQTIQLKMVRTWIAIFPKKMYTDDKQVHGKCLPSLIVGEMQIVTTTTWLLIHWVARIMKLINVGEDMEK